MTKPSLSCGPGRKRDANAYGAILAVTQELLDEVGFSKLSIEEVASRAGVGKTTIYRWWPTKGVLAMEAFLIALAPSMEFPKTDSARADIEVQAHRFAKIYRGKGGQTVRSIVGSSLADEATMKLFWDGYLAPRRAIAKEALLRGVAQGAFTKSFDPEEIIDALYGPIFTRLLIGHAPNNDHFVDTLLSSVLDSIALPPADTISKKTTRGG